MASLLFMCLKMYDGPSLILLAVERKQFRTARLLFDKGVRLPNTGFEELCILMWCPQLFVRYCEEEWGPEFVWTDMSGDTLLHRAAGRDDLYVVRYLVEERAFPVNAKNNSGVTPIVRTSDFNVLCYLAEHGADLSVKAYGDRSLLYRAIISGESDTAQYLLDKGLRE